MCEICNLSSHLLGQQQAQAMYGSALGQAQGLMGYCNGLLRGTYTSNKKSYDPKYPPTTKQSFGEFGEAMRIDSENIKRRKDRNIADVWQCRRYQQDELNKERRENYDNWIRRRDYWSEKE